MNIVAWISVACIFHAVSAKKVTVTAGCTLPNMRPPPSQRTFVSAAVDALIEQVAAKIADPNLAMLFSNALPNALDTTVFSASANDTFIITGDIEAMWLRDSTNQVWPYIPFAKQDPALSTLLEGLVARHARSILLDPFANAFQYDTIHGAGPHSDDSTNRPSFAGGSVSAMTNAIFERKYETDSLANFLRLSAAVWNSTGNSAPFVTAPWQAAVESVLQVMTDQQLDTEEEDALGGPAYTFQRQTGEPTDTLEHGRGHPAKHTGCIKSAFRGSDDALTFPYSIPENAFAVTALRMVSPLLSAVGRQDLASAALLLAAQVRCQPVCMRVYVRVCVCMYLGCVSIFVLFLLCACVLPSRVRMMAMLVICIGGHLHFNIRHLDAPKHRRQGVRLRGA
jgi:meiotically up-regulated gene 157 (Mug157) protein